MQRLQRPAVYLAVTSILSLCLVGCVTTTDPSNQGDEDDDNGTPTDVGPLPDVGGGLEDTTPDDDTGGAQEDTTTRRDTGPCEPNADFTGQVGNTMIQHGGGSVAQNTDALPADAGIQAVRDYISNNKPSGCTGDGDCIGTFDAPSEMRVEGALVTAVEFGSLGNKFFYIEDQNAGVYIRLTRDHPAPGPSGTTVKVGDIVSFDVDQLGVFQGTPQIQRFRASGATEPAFSVDSSGNPVPVRDFTQMRPTPEDFLRLVKVHGKLKNERTCDDVQDCSNNRCWKCYDLVRDGETLVTLRSQQFTGTRENEQGQQVPRDNPGYFPNSCLTYVGPVGMYEGPLDESADGSPADRLQLQVDNFAWVDK
jgi:hypothetical protein